MKALCVVLVTVAFVGPAAAARTAAVTVGDSSLTPTRVRVDEGGSVTWRNTGARSHRIASRDGSFAALTLAPGARRAVRFTRNGRHPYSVDGSRCGVVFVGVPLGAGCDAAGGGGPGRPPPPPPPPPPGADGTRIYAYDVTIRGQIRNEGFIESSGRRYQTWTRTYDWSGAFTNFRFKVIKAGATFIGVNATGSLVRSTARVTETWKFFLQPQVSSPPSADCSGTATGVVASNLLAAAGAPNLHVASQLPGGWTRDAVIEADCNDLTPPTTQVDDAFPGPDGTSVEADMTTLTMSFERRTGGLRAPVAALISGRGFTLNSGVHRSRQTTCEGDCSGTLEITERYVVTFKPHR